MLEFFETQDVDHSTGDLLRIVARPNNPVYISVENPWAGDSETGFGHSCTIVVSTKTLAAIHAHIGEILKHA